MVPFTQLVDDFSSKQDWLEPQPGNTDEMSGQFLGALYDLFVDNRGLVMTLWTADALTEEELEETGIADIDHTIAVLAQLGGRGTEILGTRSGRQDLAARSTVAMVAGMAAFGATFFGGTRPARDVIVAELTQATLHGSLHRGG